MHTAWFRAVGLAIGLALLLSGPARAVDIAVVLAEKPPILLSSYGLFDDAPRQIPATGVVPYDLNTPLFSDYAEKFRFVYMPAGTAAIYDRRDVFTFPVGSVLVKTFAYPVGTDGPDGTDRYDWNLIETRLLIHKQDGWVALPYVWNVDKSDAVLKKAGARIDVTWQSPDSTSRQVSYKVPNVNQCKGCHVQNDTFLPIGPKARHLNRTFGDQLGQPNQLVHWQQLGYLQNLPADMGTVPRVPLWDNVGDGALDARARAYLDINCAHCHTPGGPGDTSGLLLEYWRTDPISLGIGKRPVATGRGSGGRLFSIDPGYPDKSILLFRMESLDPGIMMPELGRSLVHSEAIDLIRDWIGEMPKNGATSP